MGKFGGDASLSWLHLGILDLRIVFLRDRRPLPLGLLSRVYWLLDRLKISAGHWLIGWGHWFALSSLWGAKRLRSEAFLAKLILGVGKHQAIAQASARMPLRNMP